MCEYFFLYKDAWRSGSMMSFFKRKNFTTTKNTAAKN